MFLDDVVDVVYEIEYGVMRRYHGNYTHYVETKKVMWNSREKCLCSTTKEIQRMEELIEKIPI